MDYFLHSSTFCRCCHSHDGDFWFFLCAIKSDLTIIAIRSSHFSECIQI